MESLPLTLWPQEDSHSPPMIAPRRMIRRTSRSTSNTKKTPQRGLGIARLEQICLQNKTSSFNRGEMEAFPVNLHAPVAYAGSGGQICYVPPFCVGYEPVSTIQSVMHEHYFMDRHWTLAGAAAAAELPSTQSSCVSSFNLCQFCSRKKRVFSEDLGLDGVSGVLSHYFVVMDEEQRNRKYVERRGTIFAKDREIKEYDFFPHNPIKESKGGDLVFDEQMICGSSYSVDVAANVVDLSLKLY